jgi:DNA-binding response OmpR family regulator
MEKMKEIKILVLSTHSEILNTIIRLIHSQAGWKGYGVLTLEDALEFCQTQSPDMILLGSGLSESESRNIRAEILNISPEVPVLQHYGGGSGLLFGEIQMALGMNTMEE